MSGASPGAARSAIGAAMRPSRRTLARLLAGLLLLQWAAAVLPQARALGMLGRAVAVELCSPDGARTVLLDEEGRPVEPGHAAACCDLCQGPAAIAAEAPRAPALRVAPAAAAPPRGRAGLPPLPARAPPQQPRAPPAA
ncbi:hypothetical protein EAH89_09005 [Roseomonas nepalensis]|uniref:DUF2946 domain-containing protein n=1 Tax=Muricoccus nepalensis TaxID=1854500 RepID=A0A502G8K4_9PROT|nr:DUF2946 family protein [Roseomonas nepalensis]TPG58094.1 hypothetical protein EAH89_09005 [Roseomonas nepalensis]